MFYIAVDFAFLKIFFDWFTFSGNILSNFVLLWESEYNLPIIGKPRFDWCALFFKRIAGIWETLSLLAKSTQCCKNCENAFKTLQKCPIVARMP